MTKPRADFQVGGIPIRGKLVLAPMDGYSDYPFRSLCRDLGSSISYSEFVRADDVLKRPDYLKTKLSFSDSERPVFLQLYGHQPDTMLEAALRLQERGPDAIDINLGCPKSSITRRGAGAGLMRTPLKTARIFQTLSQHLEIPLTAKIRLGWEDCQNYLLIARIIENHGGALVALHARTKERGHHGQTNWEAVARIKEQLSIPVIGNGGISGINQARKQLALTHCDGVMIGRAALSNPWIFSGKNRSEVPPKQVEHTLLDHLDRSLHFYGREQGLILFRKFASAYLAPYQLPPTQRKHLLTRTDPDVFREWIHDFFQQDLSGEV